MWVRVDEAIFRSPVFCSLPDDGTRLAYLAIAAAGTATSPPGEWPSVAVMDATLPGWVVRHVPALIAAGLLGEDPVRVIDRGFYPSETPGAARSRRYRDRHGDSHGDSHGTHTGAVTSSSSLSSPGTSVSPPRAATRPPARTRGAWEHDWVKLMCQGQDIRGVRFVEEWDRRRLAYPTPAQGVLLWEWVVDNGWPGDDWLAEAPAGIDRDAVITLIKERVHAGRDENRAAADRDEAESAARAAQNGRRSGTGLTRIA